MNTYVRGKSLPAFNANLISGPIRWPGWAEHNGDLILTICKQKSLNMHISVYKYGEDCAQVKVIISVSLRPPKCNYKFRAKF